MDCGTKHCQWHNCKHLPITSQAAGIRNLIRDEAVSASGLVVVGGTGKPVFSQSDRLVYVQLRLEKRAAAQGTSA